MDKEQLHGYISGNTEKKKMKYILNKDFRLRGWTDSIANLEYFPSRDLLELTPKECLCLMKCDGEREMDPEAFQAELKKFLEAGVISETEGAKRLPEQEYLFYPNRKIRSMNIAITGSCDFRCRHCFNAADDSPRGVTPKTEDLLRLIEELSECGVANIWLNGGEPLLNKDFLKITKAIKDHGMIFSHLISNTYHLTPEIVDELLRQGHKPMVYVSFDGVGSHEWLRQVPGSEQRTLERMAMLKEKGFYVLAHQCVWKDSLPNVWPTVYKLQELGVDKLRITSVEPSVRWKEGTKDQTISYRAWLDFSVEFLRRWYQEKIDMSLDIWGFWQHSRGSDQVRIVPDIYQDHDKEYRIPSCSDGYNRPFIDCDGRIMICQGLSGITKVYNMEWGNVYTDDLHELLRDSRLMDSFKQTVGKMKDEQEACRDCEWRDHCNFGCRPEALTQGNGLFGIDERMCIFYKEGYYDRYKEIMAEYGLKQ